MDKQNGFIQNEQEKLDNVNVVYDPNAPKRKYNRTVVEENLMSNNITKSSFKMRDYKQKLYQEFLNDCSLAQIGTSPWSTFLNVLNIVIVTLVLTLSIIVSIGMILGLRPDVVVTTSMEPSVPKGSLVVVSPVQWEEIQIGDHIAYYRKEMDAVGNVQLVNYIHKVDAKGPDYLKLVGDNPNSGFGSHVISKDAVQGKELFVLPGVGGVFVWVKNNAILTFMVLFTIVIGLLLIRKIIDVKHVSVAFAEYIKRRVDFEQRMQKSAIEEEQSSKVKTLDALLKRNY